MRSVHHAALFCALLLCACQPQTSATIAVVDSSLLRTVTTNERVPSMILSRAGILPGPADALLFNGYPVASDAPLPGAGSGTLQLRRAVSVTINGRNVQTAAQTVGEALVGAGMQLRAADGISPYASTRLTVPMAIDYTPAHELVVRGDGQEIKVLSSAPTVGAALAQAGVPLVGLDYSTPGEEEPLPSDGQVQIVRVSESTIFAQKSIPFTSEFKESPDVELGQEQILQPGLAGLAVSRVRIRYENGTEVSRETESETTVRPPQNHITVQGTKVVIKSTTINGLNIQYWRQLQMYATTYSPCNSGTNSCSSGTASGRRAGKGVVAVDPALYAYLNGQRLYIPGYGPAVIGDVGGGYIVEQNTGVSRYRWIDLGFDDNNIGDMSGWITVYFLAPAPATIPDILQ